MEAVRDNITDIGYVGTLWEGSTMPLQNVTYFTPFATGDHAVVANAFERMNETVPALRANWNGLNMGSAQLLHHRLSLSHLVQLPGPHAG